MSTIGAPGTLSPLDREELEQRLAFEDKLYTDAAHKIRVLERALELACAKLAVMSECPLTYAKGMEVRFISEARLQDNQIQSDAEGK